MLYGFWSYSESTNILSTRYKTKKTNAVHVYISATNWPICTAFCCAMQNNYSLWIFHSFLLWRVGLGVFLCTSYIHCVFFLSQVSSRYQGLGGDDAECDHNGIRDGYDRTSRSWALRCIPALIRQRGMINDMHINSESNMKV